MVKRQKEKLYASSQEQKAFGSGADGSSSWTKPQSLPFSHCALSLLPFSNPVLLKRTIFDNDAIVEFIIQHKKDPVTGEPAALADIVRLVIDKDDEGRWQDPIVGKCFHDRSKIVAVLTKDQQSAHVYSYDTYKELNVKPKSYIDLQTGDTFSPKTDVIVLYDPDDAELIQKRNISNFWHIRNGKKIQSNEGESDIRHSRTATRVLEKLQQKPLNLQDTSKFRTSNQHADESSNQPHQEYDFEVLAYDVTGLQHTTAMGAASALTSTASSSRTESTLRTATLEEILQARFRVMRKIKKKGLVRLQTTLGSMTLELDCDKTPRTCTNFLGLCRRKNYNNTAFHRLIPGFMIQGGQSLDDKDESLWGEAFADEFDPSLTHNARGVLSMANSGSHSNRQQFFITFNECSHLNNKHSVFGRVVKGEEVLDKMEEMKTDHKDRPVESILILDTEVLVDPSEEAYTKERTRLTAIAEDRLAKVKGETATNGYITLDNHGDQSVGKYLKEKLKARMVDMATAETVATERLPPPPKKTKFGNFDGW